jgi:hypothetical protein
LLNAYFLPFNFPFILCFKFFSLYYTRWGHCGIYTGSYNVSNYILHEFTSPTTN